jgi:uncharacterized protein (TIGR02453 family)
MNAADLVDFLQELRANNNKAWFDSNRSRYDALRSDFLADVTAIVEGVTGFDDKLGDISPSASLFRINRDIRFSKDKTPYKTTFSAMLVPGKKSAHGQPGYYFHIDADDELMAAGGAYMPETPVLAQMRRAIANDPAGFDKIVRKSLGDVFPELGGEKLKSTPKEFGADHPAAEYLRHKGYILFSTVEASSLSGSAVVDHVLSRFRAASPLVRFLRDTISG